MDYSQTWTNNGFVDDPGESHDTQSIAATEMTTTTTTDYASTITSRPITTVNTTEQPVQRELRHSTKTPNQAAIDAAASARSQLSRKEAQKLDEKLASFICGRVPRMTMTTAVPKLQRGIGFLVGSVDEIAEALAAGADVHLGTADANSATNQDALWYEIANKKRADVADLLLQYGATLDASKLIGCSYYSANRAILHVLLDYGADPNEWSHLGVGPLCTAAHLGNATGAQLLLEFGADPNALNPRSQKGTALLTACHKLNVDTVRVLLAHGADPNATGYDARFNPAQAALETVKRMSAANANNGRDRLVVLLTDLKAAGATDREIDLYRDPYSEATRSLIHPWDYGRHLKNLRTGRGVYDFASNSPAIAGNRNMGIIDVGRERVGSEAEGRVGGGGSARDSIVSGSEYGGSTRGLLVK